MFDLQSVSLELAAIAGAGLLMLFVFRKRLGAVNLARHSANIVILLVGALFVSAIWSDIRDQSFNRQAVFDDSGQISLPRDPDGHYYATLIINDVPVEFVVDTGATSVVLTREDAMRAGVDPGEQGFYSEARTANGSVATAPIVLTQVQFGSISDKRVRAFVNGGEMHTSLLGMSYLNRFDKIEIAGGQLVLTR
ncbi:MAG: TIGR02281 family clan AA aspartic protease [Pelagimonas sp.]|jgi:aspartyl protease family protein|nr:TIGR02281 family clan AA aspartic protease [Pelagimonas sp.]